jgi:hypothetical protein
MENSLQAKLAKVEDAHYEQAETDHIEKHADERRAQAYMFLGGAMAIDKLQNHLASQVIGAIMTVEEQKLYLEYGYDTFADFLSKSDISPVSKTQFYKLRELYLTEGPTRFDLFTNWKLPLTTRRLLAEKGVGIELEGDEVVIGGQERINVGETKAIKEIIARLVKDTIEVQEQKAKTEGKVEKLQTQIKQGQSEYELLQRKYDDATQMRPFDRSLMMSVHWQLSLLENVSNFPTPSSKSVVTTISSFSPVSFSVCVTRTTSTWLSPISTFVLTTQISTKRSMTSSPTAIYRRAKNDANPISPNSESAEQIWRSSHSPIPGMVDHFRIADLARQQRVQRIRAQDRADPARIRSSALHAGDPRGPR